MNRIDLPPLAEEDSARANHYALLARLFQAPPETELLALLAAAATLAANAQGSMAEAWRALAEAAAEVDAATVREEYERLFIGTGRPEIFLYGSYYQAGFLMEEPLADLREDLAALGLARLAGVGESEDHIAALAEVMRHLIVSGAALTQQRAFFSRHLQSWVSRLADALEAAPARFYPRAGRFLRNYFLIESAAFAMP